MDYEQKYKEALKRAKKLQETCDSTAVVGWCEYIFPELKESEDERIRKTLIENFKWYCGDFLETTKWGKDDNLLVKDIIAWLEKQDPQILANSCKTCKDEPKTAWSERDEYRYNACLQYFEEIKPDSVYYKDYLWLKSLKERINV